MATGADVLNMLIPSGGWTIRGEEYEGIIFGEATQITKKQFTDGLANYDNWKTAEAEAKATAKAALLEKLGITSEEASLLLS